MSTIRWNEASLFQYNGEFESQWVVVEVVILRYGLFIQFYICWTNCMIKQQVQDLTYALLSSK